MMSLSSALHESSVTIEIINCHCRLNWRR